MKIFIFYLCFIFFADTFGLYPIWAYYDNYETLPFLKDSPLHRNFWLYNILSAVNYLVVGQLFVGQLKKLKKYNFKKILYWFLVLFGVYSVICFSTFGEFLYAYDMSILLIGTFLVLFCIIAYFFEILLSDRILNFRSDALFYFAVAILVWHLCVTPIEIYTSFFNTSNPNFINLHATVLRYANIFMYSMFVLGFYIDYRYRLNSIKNSKTSPTDPGRKVFNSR